MTEPSSGEYISISDRVFTNNTNTNATIENRVYTISDSGVLPSLVFIRTFIYPNAVDACSGTLIGTSSSNAWVLTAKHCLSNIGARDVRRFYLCGQTQPCASNNCASNYGFSDSRFAAVNSFGDDEIYFYDSHLAARPSHFSRILPDVALVKLENLSNYPAINCHQFANIEQFQLQADNDVNVAGYGFNNPGDSNQPNNAGVLRQTRTRIRSIGMSTQYTTPRNYAQTDTYIMEPEDISTPVGIRAGDSGGPTFNIQTGNIVGVNGWIVPNDVRVIRSGSVSVSTSSMLAWIQRVVYESQTNISTPQLPPSPSFPPVSPQPPSVPSPISPPYVQYIEESMDLRYIFIVVLFFLAILLVIFIVMIVYCFTLKGTEKKDTESIQST